MVKKFLSLFLVVSLAATHFLMSICYATFIPVTDENLEVALQGFVDSASNEVGYQVSIENQMIVLSTNDEEYRVSYDLTNQPTFTQVAEIQKGMGYEEYTKATSNLSMPMIGYMAVANVQGVSYEDSMLYFMMTLLSKALSSMKASSYIIVSDDAIIEEGSKCIKESEFGNYVIDFVKDMYGEGGSFNDTEGCNTFEWSQEFKEETPDSCRIVTTLTIRPDADFSSLVGYSDTLENAFSENFPITVEEPTALSDIEGTKYEMAVKALVESGVINGFEDNTFRPMENVTRAQLAKMIVTTLSFAPNDDEMSFIFSDLSKEHWAYDYVKAAVDNGIITGYPDGTFGPENPVTFAEAMTMMLRAMNLEELMSDKTWPSGYIQEAKEAGLLDFVDYTGPDDVANRGETAISLFNMMQKLKEDSKTNTDKFNATYANDKGTVTLEELENGKMDFSYSGLAGDQMWFLGTTLDYANGVASIEEDWFDDVVKIKIVIDGNRITVEASSTDPESGYNGIDGMYLLQSK